MKTSATSIAAVAWFAVLAPACGDDTGSGGTGGGGTTTTTSSSGGGAAGGADATGGGGASATGGGGSGAAGGAGGGGIGVGDMVGAFDFNDGTVGTVSCMPGTPGFTPQFFMMGGADQVFVQCNNLALTPVGGIDIRLLDPVVGEYNVTSNLINVHLSSGTTALDTSPQGLNYVEQSKYRFTISAFDPVALTIAGDFDITFHPVSTPDVHVTGAFNLLLNQ